MDMNIIRQKAAEAAKKVFTADTLDAELQEALQKAELASNALAIAYAKGYRRVKRGKSFEGGVIKAIKKAERARWAEVNRLREAVAERDNNRILEKFANKIGL